MFDFFSQKIYWADTYSRPQNMAILILIYLKEKYEIDDSFPFSMSVESTPVYAPEKMQKVITKSYKYKVTT